MPPWEPRWEPPGRTEVLGFRTAMNNGQAAALAVGPPDSCAAREHSARLRLTMLEALIKAARLA